MFLADEDKEQDIKLFKKHARVGRPLGPKAFVESLEKATGMILRTQEPGIKKGEISDVSPDSPDSPVNMTSQESLLKNILTARGSMKF